MQRRLVGHLRELLQWERDLVRWPSLVGRAPDATAFVSLYVAGALRGCFGSDEGRSRERVARAFLRAATDARFGGITAADRDVMAVLSYAHSIRPLGAGAESMIAAGVDGLLYVRDDGSGAILLPQVARDERIGPHDLLRALARKAGVESFAQERLFAFETYDVSTHAKTGSGARRRVMQATAAFLERLVDREGRVCFMLDPRTGAKNHVGLMHHGRAAVVARALDEAGSHRPASRVRAWLSREVASAMRGSKPQGWPETIDMVAGTLALCSLAGVSVREELARVARNDEVARAPWHAAQCVAALGREAPRGLYEACVANLEEHPWAPWTALAARTMGDARVARRCAIALAASVRGARTPHAGGVGFGDVPEIALTAIVVEALADDPTPRSRSAAARARAFLERWCNRPDSPRGPLDSDVAAGGFPLTPVDDRLRCDVAAHALLALAKR